MLIVDDELLISTCITHILEGDPTMRVVGVAEDAATALCCVQEKNPDVILLDVRLPDSEGTALAAQLLAHPTSPRIRVLTGLHHEFYAPAFLSLGVSGFLNKKTANSTELVRAIKRVAAGERFLSTLVAQQLAFISSKCMEDPFDQLTQREHTIIQLILEGRTIQQIAMQLNIKPKTVYTHRMRAFEKCSVRNDVQFLLSLKRATNAAGQHRVRNA